MLMKIIKTVTTVPTGTYPNKLACKIEDDKREIRCLQRLREINKQERDELDLRIAFLEQTVTQDRRTLSVWTGNYH